MNGLVLKPKRPRAVVLCPTRELSEQVYMCACFRDCFSCVKLHIDVKRGL